VTRAEDWPWSSVRAHINGADDELVTVRRVLDPIPHYAELLTTAEDQDFADLRLAEGSGRPLGTVEFFTGVQLKLLQQVSCRRVSRRISTPQAGLRTGAVVDGGADTIVDCYNMPWSQPDGAQLE